MKRRKEEVKVNPVYVSIIQENTKRLLRFARNDVASNKVLILKGIENEEQKLKRHFKKQNISIYFNLFPIT